MKPATTAVLALRYDWRNNSVLFLHNFAGEPREVAFSTGLKGEKGDILINLLTADHSRAGKNGKHGVCLEGLWLSLVPRRRPGLSAQAQRVLSVTMPQDDQPSLRARMAKGLTSRSICVDSRILTRANGRQRWPLSLPKFRQTRMRSAS